MKINKTFYTIFFFNKQLKINFYGIEYDSFVYANCKKLFDKYSSLAKEAMSSGDKILSENYLQHADHFMRIIEDKNKNRNQNKVSLVDIPVKNNENLPDNDISKNSELKKKD